MISEFTLFVFTTCAGLAAGACAADALSPKSDTVISKRLWLFPGLMLILLGIGLLGCLGHLHRPERFLNAIWNPTAGIAQESYLSILFGLMLLLDIVISLVKKRRYKTVQIFSAIFGVALTFVMGYAYSTAIGVGEWAHLGTIPFYVFGDLAMGFALYPLFDNKSDTRSSYKTFAIVFEVLFACSLVAMAWRFASFGHDFVVFIVGIILGPCVHVALLMSSKGVSTGVKRSIVAISVIVGVALVRYAFYAVYSA